MNSLIWIRTEDELPEQDKYVLAKHNRGTWHDSTDQENVNCVIVKLVKGISKKERELLKQLQANDKRWRCVYPGDEDGNNEKPYYWNTFGPGSFNGQEITHWMPIPKL